MKQRTALSKKKHKKGCESKEKPLKTGQRRAFFLDTAEGGSKLREKKRIFSKELHIILVTFFEIFASNRVLKI